MAGKKKGVVPVMYKGIQKSVTVMFEGENYVFKYFFPKKVSAKMANWLERERRDFSILLG